MENTLQHKGWKFWPWWPISKIPGQGGGILICPVWPHYIAEVGSLCFGVNWGWIPAQHDTGAKDWLALANKAMDASAKEGAGGGGLRWRAPDAWLEGWSVFVMEGGNIVLNLKKYIMVVKTDQFKVVLEGKSYTTQVAQRTWTEMLKELKGGVKGWTKIQPLHTIDWGFSRAWSR